MKKPKKETRDVIAKHVRWTEALRVVRAYHPEVTIILPEEKIQIFPGDDVRAAIAPMVGVIRRALDAGVECVGDKVFAITKGDALTDAEKLALRNQGVL